MRAAIKRLRFSFCIYCISLCSITFAGGDPKKSTFAQSSLIPLPTQIFEKPHQIIPGSLSPRSLSASAFPPIITCVESTAEVCPYSPSGIAFSDDLMALLPDLPPIDLEPPYSRPPHGIFSRLDSSSSTEFEQQLSCSESSENPQQPLLVRVSTRNIQINKDNVANRSQVQKERVTKDINNREKHFKSVINDQRLKISELQEDQARRVAKIKKLESEIQKTAEQKLKLKKTLEKKDNDAATAAKLLDTQRQAITHLTEEKKINKEDHQNLKKTADQFKLELSRITGERNKLKTTIESLQLIINSSTKEIKLNRYIVSKLAEEKQKNEERLKKANESTHEKEALAKTLKKETNHLKAKIKDHTDLIQKQQQEIEEEQKKHQREIQKKEILLKKQRKNIEDLNKEAKQHMTRIESLQSEAQSMQTKYQNDIETRDSLIAYLKDDTEGLTTTITQHETLIESLQNKTQRQQAELKRDIDAKDTIIADLKDNIEGLATTITQHETLIKSLQAEAQKKQVELERDIEAKDALITDWEKDVEGLDAIIIKNEALIENLLIEVQDKHNLIAAQQGDIDDYKKSIKQYQDSIKKLQDTAKAKLEETKKKMEYITKEIEEKNLSLIKLKNCIKDHTKTIMLNQVELTKKDKEILKLKQTIHEHKQKNQKEKEKLEVIGKVLGQTTKKLQDLKTSWHTSQTSLNKAQNKINELTLELEHKQKKEQEWQERKNISDYIHKKTQTLLAASEEKNATLTRQYKATLEGICMTLAPAIEEPMDTEQLSLQDLEETLHSIIGYLVTKLPEAATSHLPNRDYNPYMGVYPEEWDSDHGLNSSPQYSPVLPILDDSDSYETPDNLETVDGKLLTISELKNHLDHALTLKRVRKNIELGRCITYMFSVPFPKLRELKPELKKWTPGTFRYIAFKFANQKDLINMDTIRQLCPESQEYYELLCLHVCSSPRKSLYDYHKRWNEKRQHLQPLSVACCGYFSKTDEWTVEHVNFMLWHKKDTRFNHCLKVIRRMHKVVDPETPVYQEILRDYLMLSMGLEFKEEDTVIVEGDYSEKLRTTSTNARNSGLHIPKKVGQCPFIFKRWIPKAVQTFLEHYNVKFPPKNRTARVKGSMKLKDFVEDREETGYIACLQQIGEANQYHYTQILNYYKKGTEDALAFYPISGIDLSLYDSASLFLACARMIGLSSEMLVHVGLSTINKALMRFNIEQADENSCQLYRDLLICKARGHANAGPLKRNLIEVLKIPAPGGGEWTLEKAKELQKSPLSFEE